MTDKKLDSLTAITGANLADDDEFAVVDVSDTTMDPTGTTKKITRAELGIALAPGRPKASGGAALFGIPAAIGGPGIDSLSAPALPAPCVAYTPLLLPSRITITAMSVSCFMTGGGNVRHTVFAADTDLQPTGSPMFTPVEFVIPDSDATDLIVTGLSLALPAGDYVCATQMDSDTSSFNVLLASYPVVVNTAAYDLGAASLFGCGAVSQAYGGSFPSPAPAWDTPIPADLGGTPHLVVWAWDPA